jgi:hypothetical protein
MSNLKIYRVGEMRDKIVISGVEFQNIQTHETYDRCGQQVGYYEAQAGIEILTDKAAAIVEGVNPDTFVNPGQLHIGDYFFVPDEVFSKIVEHDELEEGIDFRIFSPDVKAYNYWDGHNWRTLVLETDYGYPDLEEVRGEEAEAILTAYEDKEFSHEGFGSKTYKSGKYTFVETQFASDWYDAEVMED